MEETPAEKPFSNELQDCFTELKKMSQSYKLGQAQTQIVSGDEADPQNPLHKQFALILAKIDDHLPAHTKDSEDYIKTMCMKSSILYEKAKILLSENQLQESRILLEQALNFISEFSESSKVCFLYLRVVNHLTYVLSRLGELESAKDLLLKAIADEEKCKPEVFSTEDLFFSTPKLEKITNSKLNRLTINNMQMLSWVYAKMGETNLHLKIQHDILQKQLDLPELDPIRWAESCFKLAGIFIGAEDFQNARYHLASAESVLSPLEYSCGASPLLNNVQAELARSWVFYCLQLFDFSIKDKIKNLEENIIEDEAEEIDKSSELKDGPETTIKIEESPKICYKFEKFDVEVYEENVPWEKIKNIEGAKLLFNITQKWIKRARMYFSLRDFPLQYVNLSLDLSDAYRFLSSYEPDIDSKYLVQKKRYESLEAVSTILKEVRPTCYVAVNVELTKEVIEAQLEMMNLNMRRLYFPSEIYKRSYVNNEDHLRRNMNALAALHTQLATFSQNLDINSTICQKRNMAEIPNTGENVTESPQSEENFENGEEETVVHSEPKTQI